MTALFDATVRGVQGAPGLPRIQVAARGTAAAPSLRSLVEEGGVTAWLQAVRDRDARGDARVAAAFTAIYLIDGLVLPLTTSVLRHRRGWCTSCPLRSERDRAERFTHWLERTPMPHADN